MKYLLLSLFTLLLFLGCKESENGTLNNVTGKPGDILIVIDDNLWKQEPGNELRTALSELTPGLQQEEPRFRLKNISPSEFNDFFKSNRNIIHVKSCDLLQPESVIINNNMYATPQAYLEISASNMVKLSELIHNNSKKILDYFTQAELKRLKETYQQFKDDHIIKKISSHNIILTIPKGFKIIADSSDFTWMISESPKNTMGIFIYEYAIKDSSQYSNEYILQKRDSMLKNNCPGSVTGSWMTTEHNLPVVSQKIMNNNILMFELRGQWKVQNDFMKGPFISLTALDNKRNKAITVEGYVYAPKSEKAEFIRQLEGVLCSFKYLQ